MAKEVIAHIKLQIPAGQANPAPPVGTALGPRGVNIMSFCKEFNAATQKQAGDILPVVITVFKDKSFPDLTSDAITTRPVPCGHRFAQSSFHRHIQGATRRFEIVAEADPCAFWNVVASKVLTPLFSLKPFQTRQSPQSMAERQTCRRQSSFSCHQGLQSSTHQREPE